MNYRKIYHNLITKAKEENRERNKTIYYELHHIKPLFLFEKSRSKTNPMNKIFCQDNPDDKSNLVLLTYREHFIAHLLLYKIYKNTDFETSALRASTVFFSGKEKAKRNVYSYDLFSRGLECKKTLYRSKLSTLTKGMVMTKRADNDEIFGYVSVNDPRYISGELMFYQKGMKRSDEFRQKQVKPGDANSNYSGYSDEDLEKSFIECCVDIGFIVSKNIWAKWANKNDKPCLTSLKDFRFGGKGYQHLYDLAEEQTGMKYYEYFTRQKENFNFIEKVKHKWEK